MSYCIFLNFRNCCHSEFSRNIWYCKWSSVWIRARRYKYISILTRKPSSSSRINWSIFEHGTQLKWPDCTTSPRGSYWICQCNTPSTSTVVATFNPVNGSSTIDGATDSFGENSTNSRRNLDDSLNSPLYQYSLNPLESAKVYFDFSQLPQGFN